MRTVYYYLIGIVILGVISGGWTFLDHSQMILNQIVTIIAPLINQYWSVDLTSISDDKLYLIFQFIGLGITSLGLSGILAEYLYYNKNKDRW